MTRTRGFFRRPLDEVFTRRDVEKMQKHFERFSAWVEDLLIP